MFIYKFFVQASCFFFQEIVHVCVTNTKRIFRKRVVKEGVIATTKKVFLKREVRDLKFFVRKESFFKYNVFVNLRI